MPRDFEAILDDLQSDGGLRDFYILNANRSDWNAFLAFVQSKLEVTSYTVDAESQALPATFEAIEQIHASGAPCLAISVADAVVCCHFFWVAEIELDFRPEDYRTRERWLALCEFFQAIVDAVGKPGVITFENAQNDVIEKFEPTVSD